MKYLLLVIILAAILFSGFYYYQNGTLTPLPALATMVEARETPPSQAEARRLVWSWRYRITSEERVADHEPLVAQSIGPWLAVAVIEGEPASSRLQLPDGSFLQISGRPLGSTNGENSFKQFRYSWRGMARHHWLSAYADHFQGIQTDSVAGERSSWGYAMAATIPDSRRQSSLPAPMPNLEAAAGNAIESNASSETKPAGTKMDSTRLEVGASNAGIKRPGYDTTRPEVGVPAIKPSRLEAAAGEETQVGPSSAGLSTPTAVPVQSLERTLGTANEFQSIGSWASNKSGYQGVITLFLEMRLAPELDETP